MEPTQTELIKENERLFKLLQAERERVSQLTKQLASFCNRGEISCKCGGKIQLFGAANCLECQTGKKKHG